MNYVLVVPVSCLVFYPAIRLFHTYEIELNCVQQVSAVVDPEINGEVVTDAVDEDINDTNILHLRLPHLPYS